MNDIKQHLIVPILDLHRLDVVSALGRGAKGVVFLVSNQESNETFALKVILRNLMDDQVERDYSRIVFEQQALMSFKHPLLPRLKGVLSTDKVVGYAIDYCPGHDLNSLRKKQIEKMFSDDHIRFYAAEVVVALEYLHDHGIVYRDLKPENIMIQESGHIMLVDFDLSTKLNSKPPKPSTPRKEPERRTRRRKSLFQGLCSSGIIPEDTVFETDPIESESSVSGAKSNSFVGTEEYVAPEMLLGKGHDFAVDWWSLGILLHEMLYGYTPFKADNRKDTFRRILTEPPQLVGEPTALRDLIGKLLEKDPNKRIGLHQVKAHHFFHGLDWDLLLTLSRPPFIPSRHLEDRIGIKHIDVELFVQKVFGGSTNANSTGGAGDHKVVDDDEKNKCNGDAKRAWVTGLNNNPFETQPIFGF